MSHVRLCGGTHEEDADLAYWCCTFPSIVVFFCQDLRICSSLCAHDAVANYCRYDDFPLRCGFDLGGGGLFTLVAVIQPFGFPIVE